MAINLRPEVKWFAEVMESKLRKYDNEKGVSGWKEESRLWLYSRLVQELLELHEALTEEIPLEENILEECADVANAAMMIADKGRKSENVFTEEKE